MKLLSSLPGWFTILKVIELSLLRSKEPFWLGLYSSYKLAAITLGLSLGLFWIYFISPRVVNFFISKSINFPSLKLTPTSIFLALAILMRMTTFDHHVIVGEDVGPQVLSLYQWMDGQTFLPNFCKTPSAKDLSTDHETWIPRPPGASLIPLPGMLLGIKMGNSILISLFILSLVGGVGWIKLAQRFGFPNGQVIFLAIILAFPIGLDSKLFDTASVLSAALFPWSIVIAHKISSCWNERKNQRKLFIQNMIFFFCLGCIAWIKLSSLITFAAIICILIFLVLSTIKKKSYWLMCSILCLPVASYFIPYHLLSKTNENLTGYSSSQLYSNQDYNKQSYLWGRHFGESTKGFMLMLSLAAGPGYALPVQPFVNGFRDLLSQFQTVRNFLLNVQINRPIFLVGISSIGLTVFLFYGLFQLSPQLSTFERGCYWGLFCIPFAGLAATSYLHGFNYVLYHSYTQEFSAIFFLFSIRLLGFGKNKNLVANFLILACLVFPLYANGQRIIFSTSSTATENEPSKTERIRAMGPSFLSHAIKFAEESSTSRSDVCAFFCEGNMQDYRLRTSMRSWSMHFAKIKLSKASSFRTTKPLKVFCILEKNLSMSKSFEAELLKKFPEQTQWTKLSNQVWQATLK